MHICFLTNEYPKKGLNSGGIGTFVQFLARKLVEKQIKVSVVGINNSFENEHSKDLGVEIYRVGKSRWKFAKFYQNNKRILKVINTIDKQNSIDIVEGSELSFAFFPKRTTFKKLIRLHGGHHFFSLELGNSPKYWRSLQEKKSFKKANAYVAVSNYVGKQTQKYLANDFNYSTIYNSVDTDKFKPSITNKIKINSLLFIGTVCEKKGVRQLVESIPLIKKEIKDIHLTIVGRDWFFPDGSSYIKYLKEHINPGTKDNITIIGAVPHAKIPEIIDEAHICVYPSHMEAMPIAWLEALAKGKIVVASNIGPGNEAIINGKTGVLINPYNPNDIAKNICKLLLSKKIHTQLGKNARNDVMNRFNVDKILNENINFYRKILKDEK